VRRVGDAPAPGDGDAVVVRSAPAAAPAVSDSGHLVGEGGEVARPQGGIRRRVCRLAWVTSVGDLDDLGGVNVSEASSLAADG